MITDMTIFTTIEPLLSALRKYLFIFVQLRTKIYLEFLLS